METSSALNGAPSIGRRSFLGALGAATVVAADAGSALADPIAGPPNPTAPRGERRALVLAGGAARGAYEAGVIAGLVARGGLRDGEPLGFEAICGTSIGAINGYLIATAQYTRLRALWREVATRKIFRLKRKYARIANEASGVGTRAYEAISLGLGLTKNVRGVLDAGPIAQLLAEIVHVDDPVHIPLYINTTNLTRQRGETFLRRATTPDGKAIQLINDALIAAFKFGAIREAGDDIIHRALLASAALPIIIDPVGIPHSDGSGAFDVYVDGGVTDNVPVEIARRCAAQLHVILVDPRILPNGHYESALEIGFGMFETMQRRIFEYQTLLAIAESAIAPTPLTAAAGLNPLPVEAYLIRPQSALPGTAIDFDDVTALDAVWQRGYEDGAAGWSRLDASALNEASTTR